MDGAVAGQCAPSGLRHKSCLEAQDQKGAKQELKKQDQVQGWPPGPKGERSPSGRLVGVAGLHSFLGCSVPVVCLTVARENQQMILSGTCAIQNLLGAFLFWIAVFSG